MTSAQKRALKAKGLPIPKVEPKPHVEPVARICPPRPSGLLGMCLALGAMGGM